MILSMPAPRHFSRRDFFVVPALGRSKAADFWVRVNREIMACRFEVVLPGERAEATPVAREALDYADRLEGVMTIFREGSDLSHVNREAHVAPVPVDHELFRVLELAAAIHHRTDGAFDITSAPLSRCWGFLRRDGRIPSSEQIASALAHVGMCHVRLDSDSCTVGFDREGVALNLGAIGKGFALDRMAQFIRARGVHQALLSAGASSILGFGGGDEPWPVDLTSAVTGQRLARLHLDSGAVGTSGAGEQFFEADGVRYGHVIDPRSGWPAAGVLSASVITSDAASADALSTAFLIGGPAMAERYCARHPGVLALITPDDGSHRPLQFGSYGGVKVHGV